RLFQEGDSAGDAAGDPQAPAARVHATRQRTDAIGPRRLIQKTTPTTAVTDRRLRRLGFAFVGHEVALGVVVVVDPSLSGVQLSVWEPLGAAVVAFAGAPAAGF